jgi:hypothetical protein
MTALDRLAGLLRDSLVVEERPFPQNDQLDHVIASLHKYNKSGTGLNIPEDLQQLAVRKFWDAQRFETFKDARLVSFGMCMPSRPAGPCIMEDRQRFRAVLDRRTGIDQWLDEPKWYRRCYQGLVRSYFTYDAKAADAPTVGKENWYDLRDYLKERTHNISNSKVNPTWVTTTVESPHLFGDDPCAPYAAAILSGDTDNVDLLCEQLGVIKASWFLRELVLAHGREPTNLSLERFKDLIPRLLELLSKNRVLRDRGLILMLDKYAAIAQPTINESLRNASVEWWGNPWLPSNETSWGGVVPVAREMVSEWLKREFIEAFFTKLAQDGVGDRRRANFWLRYAKSMGNIQFALGARAMHSTDRDFQVLRKKMKGLYTELKTTDSSNNAFIMTLGDLVAVEFGGMGNAFYGYDVRKTLPFDASRPVGTTVNGTNSLKNKNRILWMQHQDGIKGWDKWENMFEATLKDHFSIRPHAALKRSAAPQDASGQVTVARPGPYPSAQLLNSREPGQITDTNQDFSKNALTAYARFNRLTVEDHSDWNGNLWIRTDDSDLGINKQLENWGFKYKPGKGWWR